MKSIQEFLFMPLAILETEGKFQTPFLSLKRKAMMIKLY